MAFSVTQLSTRAGIHEFQLNDRKVKYDATLDLLYTWTGGLVPTWGTPTTPNDNLRQQIINATNGQIGYGIHQPFFTNFPDPMLPPTNITERTKVELAPVATMTLGRIPRMRNNLRVHGIGSMPVRQRVDFNRRTPIPRKDFLEDMPTNSKDLKGFLSDWFETYGKINPLSRIPKGRRRF